MKHVAKLPKPMTEIDVITNNMKIWTHIIIAGSILLAGAVARAESPKLETHSKHAPQKEVRQSKAKAPFDKEAAIQFLNQFEGNWNGDYTIATLQGQTIQSISSDTVYYWEKKGTNPVLIGETIYTTENQANSSKSKTLIKDEKVTCIVTEQNTSRQYLGTINFKDNSISWRPYDAEHPVDENLRQSFVNTPDGLELITTGFENMKKGKQNIILSVKGVERLTHHFEQGDTKLL